MSYGDNRSDAARLRRERIENTKRLVVKRGVTLTTAKIDRCSYLTLARILRRICDEVRQAPPTPSDMTRYFERGHTPWQVLDYLMQFEPMEMRR